MPPRAVRGARARKSHFDANDDDAELPHEPGAPPGSPSALPNADADEVETAPQGLNETNDWQDRRLPNDGVAAEEADARIIVAHASTQLRKATAEERFVMLNTYNEDPQAHRRLACVQAAFPDVVDKDARFRSAEKWFLSLEATKPGCDTSGGVLSDQGRRMAYQLHAGSCTIPMTHNAFIVQINGHQFLHSIVQIDMTCTYTYALTKSMQ